MKALLVYPHYPDTFWSFRHALKFVRCKAAFPPMGLLTVAAMLPAEWPKKVVDLNVEPLNDADLDWAEVVFISAMVVQKESTEEIIARCRQKGRRTVAGGPLFTHLYKEIEGVDHCIVGEAEEVLPSFLKDLAAGRAGPIYQAEGYPDLSKTPAPMWELIDFKHYRTMSVQFSRGCPFDCEFCDVVVLFGRRPRLKPPSQVIAELERLYQLGWRGSVMLVDDNFIGHKIKAKNLLKEMITWQRAHGRPFSFFTEASVNLADDPELLSLMAAANLDMVFLGIETPSLESLRECHKVQNQNRDLVAAVKTIQSYGLDVAGGFIVGFDADPPSIFDDQASFIERAGIPTAMVGLLSVIPGSRLYERLRAQGRLLGLTSGDNVMDERALNFIPRMGREKLIAGYQSLLSRIYEPRAYYRRVLTFLRRSAPARRREDGPSYSFSWTDVAAILRILWRLGFREAGRTAFWAFLTRVGLRRPAALPVAMNFAANGYHFRMVTQRFLTRPHL